MENIKRNIQQLELAAELIDKNSPSISRLALFLLDNLAELMMYKKVTIIFARDDRNPHVIPCKYSAKKKKKVKEYFKEKVNFLVNNLKIISQSNGYILKVGHELRNEAYHKGILREKIVVPITKAYFKAVCEILSPLWLGSYMGKIGHSLFEEEKIFLSKYGIEGHRIDYDVLDKICSKILRGRKCNEIDIAQTISEDLTNRLEETINGLDYLSSGSTSGAPPSEILKWLQFNEDHGKEFRSLEGDQNYHTLRKTIEDKFINFSPKITLDALKVLMQRAKAIQHENDNGVILYKFWEIDKQFIRIENLVDESICEFDEQINLQVDAMRGG